ncbi:MAG: glycosyltransferase family 4 protein [Candidatus Sulfotelmatobacter sp.]
MEPIRILVDSFADEDLTNAQMINAREIVSRLDPSRFLVAMFVRNLPAAEIKSRPNTRLIQLPPRLQTIPLFARYVLGRHNILFYLKASPASRWYMKLRSLRRGRCVTVGTIEAQTNWQDGSVTPPARRLFEETILRCDHLYSNSKMVRRSLETNYHLPSEVIPTGVDTRFFTPNWDRPPNPRPRVLFVGSLRPFKGPQVVLDAAERHPEADFVLAGDGFMARELHTRSKAIPNVTMRGALGRAAIREEYRRSDIFLFPSRWEGSPRVLLEAGASGVPVVARKDYEPESVIDGETGYLVANEDEMMARLTRLITDAGLRRAFGQSARSHVARFSWDVIARQWETTFIGLAAALGERRPPRS